MPSVKVFYGVLLSGLVLYFLLYSFLVKKLPRMPVVKIYFEDEPPKTHIYSQQYITNEKSMDFEAGKIVEGNLSVPPPVQEFYFEREEKPSMEIANENEQTAKKDILLSFLDGLGMPVNKEEMPVADISRKDPPLVNPSGVSLRKLMEKFNEDLSLEADKPCPTSHLNEVGLLEVDNNSVRLEEVESELTFVQKGGQWRPDCLSRNKVAIVVPFRDRYEHLYIFLRHMHQFLRWQMLDYRIFIVEQQIPIIALVWFAAAVYQANLVDPWFVFWQDVVELKYPHQQSEGEAFNRGMLMNVGFSEALKKENFTCVIFHDVDLIPEDARNDYGCPSSPRHMSTAVSRMDYKLAYKTLFGGVEGFWSDHYRLINGFPNRFWGWGGEDDDLYIRVTERRLSFTRPALMIGRYTMLHHSHLEDDKNPMRFDELRKSEASIDMDGLNTLTYNVLDYQEMPLYTFIAVSLR